MFGQFLKGLIGCPDLLHSFFGKFGEVIAFASVVHTISTLVLAVVLFLGSFYQMVRTYTIPVTAGMTHLHTRSKLFDFFKYE